MTECFRNVIGNDFMQVRGQEVKRVVNGGNDDPYRFVYFWQSV